MQFTGEGVLRISREKTNDLHLPILQAANWRITVLPDLFTVLSLAHSPDCQGGRPNADRGGSAGCDRAPTRLESVHKKLESISNGRGEETRVHDHS